MTQKYGISPVKAYVGLIVLATIPIWALAVQHGFRISVAWLLFFFALSFGAEFNRVKIGDVVNNVTFAIDFSLMLIYGWEISLLIAVLNSLLSDLRYRLPLIKVLFNAAQTSLSIFCAGNILQHFGVSAANLNIVQDVVPLLLSAFSFFLVNTWSVATAIGLATSHNVISIWLTDLSIYAFFHLGLTPIGILMALIYNTQPAAVVLLVLPLAVAAYAYKSFVDLKVTVGKALEKLAAAVDRRDRYTARHSERVSELAVTIAEQLGLPEWEIRLIASAALIHDLGKIAISDAILQKPAALNTEEYEAIKSHSEIGADMVQGLPGYRAGADIIIHHHDRFDGKGYPTPTRGKLIPLGARIIAVADTFDAMTTDRPYRLAVDRDTAIKEIMQHSGSQFDPDVVAAFLKAMGNRKGE